MTESVKRKILTARQVIIMRGLKPKCIYLAYQDYRELLEEIGVTSVKRTPCKEELYGMEIIRVDRSGSWVDITAEPHE